MRENVIERHFCRSVELTDGIHRKVQWIGRWGAPDRWVGWPGKKRTGWVELKGDGGSLAVLQKREHERLRACGERVDVLWSIEDVDRYIEEMTR